MFLASYVSCFNKCPSEGDQTIFSARNFPTEYPNMSGKNGLICLVFLYLSIVGISSAQSFSSSYDSTSQRDADPSGGAMAGYPYPPDMGTGGGTGGGIYPPVGVLGPEDSPHMGPGPDYAPGEEYPQELGPDTDVGDDQEAVDVAGEENLAQRGTTQDAGSGSVDIEQQGAQIQNGEDRSTTYANDTGNDADDIHTHIKSGMANPGDAHPIQITSHNSTAAEEDNFNYTGMYVTIGIMIAFMVTIVAIGFIRGPQGPFKTKRSDGEVRMMMAQLAGQHGQSKTELAALEECGSASAPSDAQWGARADAQLDARTDAQWEQQPLQQNEYVYEDEVKVLPKDMNETATTTTTATGDEKVEYREM